MPPYKIYDLAWQPAAWAKFALKPRRALETPGNWGGGGGSKGQTPDPGFWLGFRGTRFQKWSQFENLSEIWLHSDWRS